MAVTDYDQLTSITREKILPGIVDAITGDNVLCYRLLKNAKTLSGGKRIEKVVKYAISTQGGWYDGLDVLEHSRDTTRTRAYWEWRQCHQAIVLSNIEIAKNKGPEGVFDLLKTDMEEAKLDMKDRFGDATYTAQTGDAIDSLVDACDDGTNTPTYGGILRTTPYTWWQGDYTASGGTFALSAMATPYDAVKSGSEKPTIIVTPEALWTAHEALLHPQVRYNITSGAGPAKVDGGFDSIGFRGVPHVADEYCTSGYMYMLNERHLDFYVLKHPDFPTDKSGFTLTKLREPSAQDGKIGFILWYGNLVCTAPKYQAVVRGLS